MNIADNDGLNFCLISTVWQNRARLGKFSVPSCPVNQGGGGMRRCLDERGAMHFHKQNFGQKGLFARGTGRRRLAVTEVG
jgi:hypothetical protein